LAQDEQLEPESGTDEPESAEEDGGAGKAKRSSGKGRRSHADRALAQLRAAKKAQRDVTDPVERARLQLAEANVLALLELADAIAGGSGDEAPSPE
jgi:hypothetical protein